MEIYLRDNSDTGHHYIYQQSLKEIKNTYIKNKIINFTSVRKNYFKAYKERKLFLSELDDDLNKKRLIHLLYIDSIYKCPMIHRALHNKYNKYIGTLHWVPKNKINKILLKKFCGKLEYVIVHSEYLQNQLIQIGINNVKCIDYPSFINYNEKCNNKEDKIIISCLGGTRFDKGLDIVINSFEYIDDNIKEKIVFNIAGIEQDILYKDLINVAKRHNININIKNKFLTDKEYEYEIYSSDVILLPYKKIFSGNSGPMTDGIYMNKFIVGPNEGNLGYLINKYDLGLTFEQENCMDLARKISMLSKLNLKKDHEYKNELDVEKFIKKHESLYKFIEEQV